jgi:hypothetical protein
VGDPHLHRFPTGRLSRARQTEMKQRGRPCAGKGAVDFSSGAGGEGRLGVWLSLGALWLGMVSPAQAIKEYELRRFLMLKSECRLQTIVADSVDASGHRFNVSCGDSTAFPDGAEVLCPEPEDDRSCRMLTTPRRFDKLGW